LHVYLLVDLRIFLDSFGYSFAHVRLVVFRHAAGPPKSAKQRLIVQDDTVRTHDAIVSCGYHAAWLGGMPASFITLVENQATKTHKTNRSLCSQVLESSGTPLTIVHCTGNEHRNITNATSKNEFLGDEGLRLSALGSS